MQYYEAKAKITDWILILIAIPAITLFYGLLLFALLSIILKQAGFDLMGSSYAIELQIALLCIIFVSFLRYQIWESRFINYWKLTEIKLIRGNPSNMEINLNDISEIKIGMPYPRYWNILRQFMRSEGVREIEILYETALIIRTRNRQTLLFQPIKLAGGPEMMNHLTRMKSSCIRILLFYSEKEVKFLKVKNINKILNL